MSFEVEHIGPHTLYRGDCLEILPTLEAGSVDSVVTDPPYGLAFMGKDWDRGVPGVRFWESISRVCLPGSPLLAFGGTRTSHRLVCAIEDAGWEIRDCVMWLYGSGFPKSLDIGKAIDAAAGAEREVVGTTTHPDGRPRTLVERDIGCHGGGQKTNGVGLDITAPASESARLWDGYGTALKPAHEPICLAMKPLDGTFAGNALEHGVAGVNVDGCRIGTEEETARKPSPNHSEIYAQDDTTKSMLRGGNGHDLGRWPANVIHDGSDEVLAGFPSPHGAGHARDGSANPRDNQHVPTSYNLHNNTGGMFRIGDSGSAARFFYTAKASKAERNWGCGELGDEVLARSCQAIAEARRGNTVDAEDGAFNKARVVKNNHPTVKPLALMEYLIRLVTMPEPKLLLDPFMGSGSTGVACARLGRTFIGIEIEQKYFDIACKRIEAEVKQGKFEFAGATA